MDSLKKLFTRLWPWIVIGLAVSFLTLYWFREPLMSYLTKAYGVLIDRDRFAAYVDSYGTAAPAVFMAIQILQVIFAPIPGEATGFIGGYLFGAFKGCLYSTVALSLGSMINFGLGRFLGKRLVRRLIPMEKLTRFDHIVRHQGLLVVFTFFLIPGFPKDYLCLFLGISTIPARVFFLMASIGRIPGTLMLSLQGALLFEKNYLIFCLIVGISLVAIFIGYRHRVALYDWIEKINGQPEAAIDEDED